MPVCVCVFKRFSYLFCCVYVCVCVWVCVLISMCLSIVDLYLFIDLFNCREETQLSIINKLSFRRLSIVHRVRFLYSGLCFSYQVFFLFLFALSPYFSFEIFYTDRRGYDKKDRMSKSSKKKKKKSDCPKINCYKTECARTGIFSSLYRGTHTCTDTHICIYRYAFIASTRPHMQTSRIRGQSPNSM